VSFFGGDEDVFDVVLGQGIVQGLGARKEAIGFAAGDIEELQFLLEAAGSARILSCASIPSGADTTTGAEGSRGRCPDDSGRC
jgi:hypothetical protein